MLVELVIFWELRLYHLTTAVQSDRWTTSKYRESDLKADMSFIYCNYDMALMHQYMRESKLDTGEKSGTQSI